MKAGQNQVIHSAPPPTITQCDHVMGNTNCGRWEWDGVGGYRATWDHGEVSHISVARFDGDSMEFLRQDKSGTKLQATYSGRVVDGHVIDGVISWTKFGKTFTATWTGELIYPPVKPAGNLTEETPASPFGQDKPSVGVAAPQPGSHDYITKNDPHYYDNPLIGTWVPGSYENCPNTFEPMRGRKPTKAECAEGAKAFILTYTPTELIVDGHHYSVEYENPSKTAVAIIFTSEEGRKYFGGTKSQCILLNGNTLSGHCGSSYQLDGQRMKKLDSPLE